MCGIVAAFEFKDSEKIRTQVLEMSKKIRHRGPDWTGIYSSKKAILAHERLSIVDPESGKQPLYSKNKELILAANGEIYNHKSLRQILLNRGHTFKTSSDTESILNGYAEWGFKVVNHLRGMFSFGIWDSKKNLLFLARDRLGIKPLYIYEKNNELIYSSEIASILDIYDSDFDEFGLRQYRKLRMTLKGYTIYKDIKQFPAGSYSINSKITKYWDINPERTDDPSDEKLDFLLNLKK